MSFQYVDAKENIFTITALLVDPYFFNRMWE